MSRQCDTGATARIKFIAITICFELEHHRELLGRWPFCGMYVLDVQDLRKALKRIQVATKAQQMTSESKKYLLNENRVRGPGL